MFLIYLKKLESWPILIRQHHVIRFKYILLYIYIKNFMKKISLSVPGRKSYCETMKSNYAFQYKNFK